MIEGSKTAKAKESVTGPVKARKLGAPVEIWHKIAGYLNPIALNHFVRSTQLFKEAGTDPAITKPVCQNLYNRLRKIDACLPLTLVTEDPIREYLKALETVEKAQQQEFAQLSKDYPEITSRHRNLVQPQLGTMSPLKRLEAVDLVLDQINIEIITSYIIPTQTKLDISNIGITRIPQRLLNDPAHKTYFDELDEIDCSNNNIRVLTLDNLENLASLECQSNGMRVLILGNLPCFTSLNCSYNDLEGTLDLRRYDHFFTLGCYNNKLSAIYLSRVLELEYFNCSNNLLRELIIEGVGISNLNCSNNLLTSLRIADITYLLNTEASPCLIQGNYLETIPKDLVTKFGKRWSNQQLSSQHRPAVIVPKEESPQPDNSKTYRKK